MTVQILDDAEAMAQAAVAFVVNAASTAIAEKGIFTIAFSGGGTPKRTYELLASAKIDWSKVEVFWVDERHVPATDKDSNEHLVRETLLSKVAVPENHIHPMVTGATPAESAAAYDDLIASTPALDLAIMGIGPDGHTASLFPGIAELKEAEKLVVPTLSPANVRERVTLTIPALSKISTLLFLVEGEGKRDSLRKILQHEEPLLPAALVADATKNAVWLVSKDAVS